MEVALFINAEKQARAAVHILTNTACGDAAETVWKDYGNSADTVRTKCGPAADAMSECTPGDHRSGMSNHVLSRDHHNMKVSKVQSQFKL